MSTPTDQPRTPAGSPQGGQFASSPGGGEGPHLTGDLEFGPNTAGVQATEHPSHLGTRPTRSIPATDLKPGDVLADGEFFHHEQVLTVHRSGGVTVVTTTGSEENFAGPYRFQPNDTISICNT